jgi:acetyl esterase
MVYPNVTSYLEQRPKSELKYGNGGYFILIDSTHMGQTQRLYLNDESERLNPYVSPLLADDLSNLPPASFFSAECDPLLDQGLMYAAALEDAGNQVDYHIYKGMLHAFLNRTYQKTFECLDDIIKCVPRPR